MKKTFMIAALACVLGMGSCSDSFETSLDFGDKTYINDYGKLVDAVNNLNATLSERLGALNTLLEAGLYNIKVAIDENTGAINLQTTALKDGLGTLNTTFLEGFTALNTTLNSNGEKIVNAIGAQGDLIALHLDKNGQLISAQIDGSTKELIEALKDNNKGIEDKLAAINTSISTGLTQLKVSTDAIGSELKVTNTKLDAMNGHLGNLDADLQAQTVKIGELSANVLNGFTTLNKTQQENGEKVVSAINKNGEVISAQIKSTGEVIEAQLKTSTTAIIEGLKTDFDNLGSKIDAFNTAVNTGLLNISEKINNVDGSIKLQTKAIEGVDSSIKAQTEKIAELSKDFLKEFQTVNSNLSTINTSIGAVNTSIGEVKTAIKDMNDALGLKFDAQNTELKNIVSKINDNTTAINNLSSDLTAQLKALNDNITAQGGKLVAAINDKGQLIVNALDKNNKVLETINTGIVTIADKLDGINGSLASMDTKLETLNGNIIAINKSLGTINTNIQTLATKVEEGDKLIAERIKALEPYLKSIVLDEADKHDDKTYNCVYINPLAWGSIKESEQAMKSIENLLYREAVVPTNMQSHVANISQINYDRNTLFANLNDWHEHSDWSTPVEEDDEVVIAGTVVKDGVTLFQVRRVVPSSVFNVRVSDQIDVNGNIQACGYPCITALWVSDAKGQRWVFFGKDTKTATKAFGYLKNIKLNLYDPETGVYCAQPECRLYAAPESSIRHENWSYVDEVDCTNK